MKLTFGEADRTEIIRAVRLGGDHTGVGRCDGGLRGPYRRPIGVIALISRKSGERKHHVRAEGGAGNKVTGTILNISLTSAGGVDKQEA